MLNENIGHNEAVLIVRQEIEKYKASLEKSKTKYKIIEEVNQPDGSVIIRINKQYNMSPVGSYLD